MNISRIDPKFEEFKIIVPENAFVVCSTKKWFFGKRFLGRTIFLPMRNVENNADSTL